MKGLLIIVSSAPFPIGGASTNRKISLAKGFVENGFRVIHLSYRVYKENDHFIARKGNYEGIEYINFNGKSTGKFNKIVHYIKGLSKLLYYILRINNRTKKKLLWSNEFRLFINFPLFVISKLKKMFYFSEYNENPLGNDYSNICLKKTIIEISFKLYDAFFPMTNTLKKLLFEVYNVRKPIIVVNNTVDLSRFKDVKRLSITPTILYVGSFSFYKDGIDIALKAFTMLPEKYNNFKFRLIGFSNSPDNDRIHQLVKELGISECLEFLYDVPSNKIPGYLSESQLLILTRIPNELTTYGFPTKLVEYLASGRPVVITKTSDIPLYLKDGENAFVVDGYSEESISQKIVEALDDIDHAELIGNKGKIVASSFFNSNIESKKIINHFFEESSE